MKIETTSIGTELSIHLEGEVSGVDTKLIFNAIREFKKNTHKMVIIDLSGVTYIDSIGLGTLIDLRQTLSQAGVKLNLSGTRDNVKKLFWDCNLHLLFDIEPPPKKDS